MNELPSVSPAAETTLPMFDVVGWAVLVVSLLITVVWLAYLYR